MSSANVLPYFLNLRDTADVQYSAMSEEQQKQHDQLIGSVKNLNSSVNKLTEVIPSTPFDKVVASPTQNTMKENKSMQVRLSNQFYSSTVLRNAKKILFQILISQLLQ